MFLLRHRLLPSSGCHSSRRTVAGAEVWSLVAGVAAIGVEGHAGAAAAVIGDSVVAVFVIEDPVVVVVVVVVVVGIGVGAVVAGGLVGTAAAVVGV